VSATTSGDYDETGNNDQLRRAAVAQPVQPVPLRCTSWVLGPGRGVVYDAAQSRIFTGTGGAVLILNVANPANPVLVRQITTRNGLVEGLDYDASTQILAVAAGKGGVELWDVSPGAAPTFRSQFDLDYFGTKPEALDVKVANNIAYIAADYAGLHHWDISTPASPSQLGFFVPQDTTLSLSLAGGGSNVLYTTQGATEAAAFLLDPAGTPIFQTDTPFSGGSFGFGVYATPTLAYVAAGGGGLFIYNFSMGPMGAFLTLVGSLPTPNSARGVAVDGNILGDGSIANFI